MSGLAENAARSRRDVALDNMVALWSAVEWPDVATFIGPNAERFKKVFEKMRADALNRRTAIAWSFSWPALFFSFAWFFARKQWLMGGLLLGLPILASFFLPAASFGGIGIFIAANAKWAYLQTSVPKIAKIVQANPPGATRDAALAAVGGISKAGAIVGGIVLLAALAAFIMSIRTQPLP